MNMFTLGSPSLGYLSPPSAYEPYASNTFRPPPTGPYGPTGNLRYAARDTMFFQRMGLHGRYATGSPMNNGFATVMRHRVAEDPVMRASTVPVTSTELLSPLPAQRAPLGLGRQKLVADPTLKSASRVGKLDLIDSFSSR